MLSALWHRTKIICDPQSLHTEVDTHHTTFWNNLHNSKQEQYALHPPQPNIRPPQDYNMTAALQQTWPGHYPGLHPIQENLQLPLFQRFPKRKRAAGILQEWNSQHCRNSPRMKQSTLPFFNTDTNILKIYQSQPSTSYSSHYLHISHRLGPLKGPFLEFSAPCGMVKAPAPFPPSAAVTGQNFSNFPRKHTHFFLPITPHT